MALSESDLIYHMARRTRDAIHQDHIAYALAVHGQFDGPSFKAFTAGKRWRGHYHKYWNHASIISAGFRGRIN